MSGNALFIHHEKSLNYHFHDLHPFHPVRFELTLDLLRHIGALQPTQTLSYSPVTEEQLLWVHQPSYVEAVKQLSVSAPDPFWINRAEQYGLMDDDTPYFIGMHEAAAHIAGGTVAAVDAVMTGTATHALHLSGGLHHALSAKAAGFCIYNDLSVAIAHARLKYNARVLYVDTDVHHGDGIQWNFYSDPDVFTYSIHETGKYLFPGTGTVQERGEHQGYGACINIPLQPYTEDDSWMECFETSLRRVTDYFKPDLIISQHGCDAHALDPLSHIHCSMAIYNKMPAIIHELSHEYSSGRWVAVGGGGYDMWRVVPRAWSLLWLEMSHHPLNQSIKQQPSLHLPQTWIDTWQKHTQTPLPTVWLDDLTRWKAIPRREEITTKNRETLAVALQEYP